MECSDCGPPPNGILNIPPPPPLPLTKLINACSSELGEDCENVLKDTFDSSNVNPNTWLIIAVIIIVIIIATIVVLYIQRRRRRNGNPEDLAQNIPLRDMGPPN